MHIKGFNEYEEEPISAQALLDGGILNPLAKKEDQIEVKGFRKYFTVFGLASGPASIRNSWSIRLMSEVLPAPQPPWMAMVIGVAHSLMKLATPLTKPSSKSLSSFVATSAKA